MNPFSEFYSKNLGNYGASSRGVGWKNDEAQTVRFEQLLKLLPVSNYFSINDLGCGVGTFAAFLKVRNFQFSYRGYDLLSEMIAVAAESYQGATNVSFSVVKNASEMLPADFTVASGIFNIRFEQNDASWLEALKATLHQIDEKSSKGFAFNLLSIYSDVEFRKPELYYADPCFLFDYCKRNFSREVALLHDYGQYDFTLLVRKK